MHIYLRRLLSLFHSPILKTVSKVKEKGYFGRKFCKFKILFEREIYILVYLKMITWISKLLFFSLTHTHTHTHIHTHTHTQIPLSAQEYFFPLSQPFFRIFFPIKPTQWRSLSDSWKHKVPQGILYMDYYFSQERHKIAKIQRFLYVVHFFFCNIRIAEIRYSK